MKEFSVNLFVLLFAIARVATPAMAEETAVAEEVGNNLSFPVIAVDGFSITPVTESWVTTYTGTYSDDLTDEEIAWLDNNGPWYPQKTEGNTWQAPILLEGAVDVTFIDWGDNIESVNPKLNKPFRLEVTLYKRLDSPSAAYTMAVLENPSSPDELQGTNQQTYESNYATVISPRPKLSIQYLGISSKPENLTWNGTQWVIDGVTGPPLIPITFAPELNVAGKYVFGASKGGWTPLDIGWYRLTFYISGSDPSSGVNLTGATIANYSDEFTGTSEGTAAFPVVGEQNLSYVDIKVTKGGGERRGGNR